MRSLLSIGQGFVGQVFVGQVSVGLVTIGFATLCVAGATGVARGETISGALVAAYRNNPALGAERAATRAADEDVSKAEAGYRPHAESTGSFGYTYTDAQAKKIDDLRTGPTTPTQADLTVRETVFDGNRTTNGVRRAESMVFGSRERLRQSEQDTLLGAASAYMDVLRDIASLDLHRSAILVYEVELRDARGRYRVGEVTSTDVAQVESALARERTQYFQSQAALAKSLATYRRYVGVPAKRLEAARPIDALTPASLSAAIALAMTEHPKIAEALHAVDAARTEVEIREGELYPKLDAVGKGLRSKEHGTYLSSRSHIGVSGDLTVPFYDGGETYARIREAKEMVSREALRADLARAMVRAEVVTAWAQLDATRSLIHSTQVAVKAAEVALVDVRGEASLGQRTTYDVLLAIQTLTKARVSLVSAQRDRVVASYALMGATGRLGAAALGLPVEPYDPTLHLVQVKDKWFGLRTPDGR